MPSSTDMKKFEDARDKLAARFDLDEVTFYMGYFCVLGRVKSLPVKVYFDTGDETWVSQVRVLDFNIAQHSHDPCHAFELMLVRVREHLDYVGHQLGLVVLDQKREADG